MSNRLGRGYGPKGHRAYRANPLDFRRVMAIAAIVSMVFLTFGFAVR